MRKSGTRSVSAESRAWSKVTSDSPQVPAKATQARSSRLCSTSGRRRRSSQVTSPE